MNVIDAVSDLGAWVQAHPWQTAAGLGALPLAAGLASWWQRGWHTQTTHGSARWATPREAKRAGLYGAQGIILGRLGKVLRHGGPEHILLCGPSRSGKGISSIIPTLLTWPVLSSATESLQIRVVFSL